MPEINQLLDALGTRVKYVFRNYPLPNLHPLALQSAIVAESAGLQERFWDMHEMILKNQKYLNLSSFNLFAEEIGLDMEAFDRQRQSKQLFQKIISDFESGIRSGVDSTPTFFINGFRYNGFDDFQSLYKVCKCATMFNEINSYEEKFIHRKSDPSAASQRI
jgi:protein-disulfide isomerase